MVEYFNHAGTTPPFQQTGNFHFANRFSMTADFTANSFWWYFDGSGSAKPQNVVLWNVTDNLMVFNKTDSATQLSAGWYQEATPFAVNLLSGKTYSFGISDDTGMRWHAWATSPPAVNSPFSHIGTRYGNGTGIPGNTASWELFALDLDGATAGGGGGGGGATPGDVAAELAKWLSNVAATNIHQSDGLPWQTKLDTGAIKAVTDRLNGLSNAAITRLNTLSDAAITALNNASDGANSWMGDIKARITGSSGGGGSAFYGPGGTQVSAGVETLLARDPISSAKINALLGLPVFPAAPWAQVAATTFDTNLAWAQPADLYSVHFTTLGSNLINTTVAGVPTSYRLAWWTILNSNHPRERRFIDFPDVHCWDEGRHMPGLLLRSNAGGTGTVEAWSLPT